MDMEHMEDIFDMMKKLAEELTDKEQRLYEIERRLLTLSRKQASEEAELLSAINEETDGSGKKTYSNETLRKAELARRKQGSAVSLEQAQLLDDKGALEVGHRICEREYRRMALYVEYGATLNLKGAGGCLLSQLLSLQEGRKS